MGKGRKKVGLRPKKVEEMAKKEGGEKMNGVCGGGGRRRKNLRL